MKKLDTGERLFWLDMEMTGLNPDKDKILEIACLITDGELNILEEGPDLVIHRREKYLKNLNEWVIEQHTKSGLFKKVKESKVSAKKVENTILKFLKKHGEPKKVLLCGNSVYFDRYFLIVEMPKIVNFLHHRIIDVSTVKELYKRWYPKKPEFEKKQGHRAMDDIKESLAELSYYRKEIFR